MTFSSFYILGAITVASLVTFTVRLLPFLIPEKFFIGEKMKKISLLLPAAIMLILVIYSLGGSKIEPNFLLLYKIIALITAGIIYYFKESMLLSLLSSWLLYMTFLHIMH